MKLTIDVPDSLVGINGEFRKIDLATLDPKIRAVQWDGAKGHIEFNSDLPNESISDISTLTSIIDAWNALTPLPPPSPLPPTIDEIAIKFKQSIQLLLDTEAQKLGYDSILSACSYATSSHVPFSTEGKSFVDWRDNVWLYCYAELAKVQAGTIAIPSLDQIISELPKRAI